MTEKDRGKNEDNDHSNIEEKNTFVRMIMTCSLRRKVMKIFQLYWHQFLSFNNRLLMLIEVRFVFYYFTSRRTDDLELNCQCFIHKTLFVFFVLLSSSRSLIDPSLSSILASNKKKERNAFLLLSLAFILLLLLVVVVQWSSFAIPYTKNKFLRHVSE